MITINKACLFRNSAYTHTHTHTHTNTYIHTQW